VAEIGVALRGMEVGLVPTGLMSLIYRFPSSLFFRLVFAILYFRLLILLFRNASQVAMVR
jgi:hypothetical protein